jgi:tRNA (guanine-N7-)-methyltransferase
MERQMRVGRDEFEIDPARQEKDDERYDEGRGLIGGDPSKRPAHVRWRPIPEEEPYFRLIDISAAKRARLERFLAQKPLEVEIGFGNGEFLLGRAAAHPERRFLGFEVKRELCRAVAGEIAGQGLENLWISDDDARWALGQLGIEGQADVIHVLYPDPWWKRRHHAKRLFRAPFVEQVHGLLAPDGLLHVRSDVEGYARLVEEVVGEHGGFTAADSDRVAEFAADPPTRREAYCRRIGRPFWVMGFGKTG